MRIRSLASGSFANCLVVDVGHAVYVLDAGLPHDAMVRRLAASGISPQDVAGVILSHEHVDHGRSALSFCETLGIPIYALRETMLQLGVSPKRGVNLVLGRSNTVDGLLVVPVPVNHDAVRPCGFLLEFGGTTLGYFVDLGSFDEGVLEHMGQADLLVLEANHDDQLLWSGPYPYILKRRIAGPEGHLSNRQAAEALSRLRRMPRKVMLAHLSANNNRPELAIREVVKTLGVDGSSIVVLPRGGAGPWVGAGPKSPFP